MASSKTVELSKQESEALAAVTKGGNEFAIKLYKALASKEKGNVIMSPLSVQMVLALTYTGAKGTTASELEKHLSLPDKIENTYLGYHSTLKILQNPALTMANRMFVEGKAPLNPEFQKNAEKYFLSPAEPVNFIETADKARVHINKWVEEQTKKKITDLLAPETVGHNTKLILVNAVHFKADWQNTFEKKNTKIEPFHVSKTQTKQVEMMHTVGKEGFGFIHDKKLGAKILSLLYIGFEFRMIAILPDEIEGLANVEAKLENASLTEKIKSMVYPTVTVALPKFKLEETMELTTTLESIGIVTLFSMQANLSGLSDLPFLTVSGLVQKASVEVNEEGTEAAAATAVVCTDSIRPPPQVFQADRPFLFLIFHIKSGSILFIGRYLRP